VAGSGGVAGKGGAGGGGKAGNGGAAGGAGTGGAAGTIGAGGAADPCLQAVIDPAGFTADTGGLTSGVENFSVDASGNAVTSFGYYQGNNFAHHADVTFGSFAASSQVAAGTTATTVFSLGGPGVKSSLGFAPGFDGITSTFSSPEVVVFIAARSNGPDGFTLSVKSSDNSNRTTFVFYPASLVPNDGGVATGPLYAGVRSTCGPIIQLVDFSPNYTATGNGNSQYWELASVSYAR
jgi:hypothetical protein